MNSEIYLVEQVIASLVESLEYSAISSLCDVDTARVVGESMAIISPIVVDDLDDYPLDRIVCSGGVEFLKVIVSQDSSYLVELLSEITSDAISFADQLNESEQVIDLKAISTKVSKRQIAGSQVVGIVLSFDMVCGRCE